MPSATYVGRSAAERRTRLVATLGPATDSDEVMRGLILAGLNVARINSAHGGADDIRRRAAQARRCAADVGREVALLLDLQGPKIRVGNLAQPITLVEDETVCLSAADTDTDTDTDGGALTGTARIPIDYPPLAREVEPGQAILLSDGMLRLEAIDSDAAKSVRCRVVVGGLLRAHKGVNLPETTLSVATPTDKDLADAQLGLAAGVDFLGLSFVRRAADIERLRASIGAAVPIVAKIERPEALRHIDEIAHAADAVMVARGDLGVELPLEAVPQAQLAIIQAARRCGTPVIVATELLESMQVNERPTRAEVTDVFYAVTSRTDGVMLSAESAVGQHPIGTVQMLSRVAAAAEVTLSTTAPEPPSEGNQTTWVAYSAVTLARALDARAIVTPTTTGLTPRQVARFRPPMPILAIVPDAGVARRLALTWGVSPIVAEMPHDTDGLIRSTLRAIVAAGAAHEGDTVILTTGVPVGKAGSTNLVKVHKLGEAFL